MSGAVSTWALTREVMRETGGEGGLSCGLLGLEGRRPRRPLSESVLTTEKRSRVIKNVHDTKKI